MLCNKNICLYNFQKVRKVIQKVSAVQLARQDWLNIRKIKNKTIFGWGMFATCSVVCSFFRRVNSSYDHSITSFQVTIMFICFITFDDADITNRFNKLAINNICSYNYRRYRSYSNAPIPLPFSYRPRQSIISLPFYNKMISRGCIFKVLCLRRRFVRRHMGGVI